MAKQNENPEKECEELMKCFDAFSKVLEILKPLTRDQKHRILNASSLFYAVDVNADHYED